MKWKRTLGILGICVAGHGCGPITLATRTLVLEPVHYCMSANALSETRRNYKLAEQIWEAILKEDRDHPYSADYACGFKDGFADYLYAGGTGEPPPLPPRHYWTIHYETPEGHRAIADWFVGFRHGATIAQQSGYREWVTLPASAPLRLTRDRPGSDMMPES